MTINCPVCDTSLKNVFYEGNSVKLCFSCKGMLLTKQNLKNIEESREIEIPKDTPYPSRKTEVGRICPSCNISMKKITRGKIRKTIIDVCEKCTAIWLDKGELESIQADYEACENNIALNKNRSKKSETIKCPKCNHPQALSKECIKCGIIFEKYNAVQEQIESERQKEKQLDSNIDDIYSELKGYDFKQQPSYLEGLTGFETRNEYSIGLTGTNYTWLAKETRGITTALLRNILGGLYPYTLEVYDHNRNLIFKLREKARLYFGRTDIYDSKGKHLGYIERKFSLLIRKVAIYNTRGKIIYYLTTKLTNPYLFTIFKNNRKVGEVTKKWSGHIREFITDADNFSIRFNRATDKNSKILYLGAAYLIDKTYFEGGDNQQTFGQVLGIPFLDSIYGRIILALLVFAFFYVFIDN